MSHDRLEQLARLLGSCSLFGLALVTLWFAAFRAGLLADWHGRLFGLGEHELAALTYGGLAVMKSLVLVLFVVPWAALRWELSRGRRR